jgi:hypothetical protein
MTGVPPSGSGLRPDGLSQSALSQAEPLVPNAATISGFIRAMQQRFIERAALGHDRAILAAVATLDAWECVFNEPIELTEDYANSIVDSELEHWEVA